MKSLYSTIVSLLFLLLLTSCGLQSIPTANNDVEAKWAQVVNQYKRRADLIPNLVKTVKGYAAHESKTLTDVVNARAKATGMNINAKDLNPEAMKKFSKAQGALSGALSRLMVVVEKYPDLKANQNFRDLQAQLEGTENRITVARKRYIESIQQFNNLVTVFPTSIMNSFYFKFDKKPQFTVENVDEVQKAPSVEF